MYGNQNLGISPGFQPIILNPHDTRGLRFPAQMKYDYVRLYQPARQEPKVSCDPPDYPTAAYINKVCVTPTTHSRNMTPIPPGFLYWLLLQSSALCDVAVPRSWVRPWSCYLHRSLPTDTLRCPVMWCDVV